MMMFSLGAGAVELGFYESGKKVQSYSLESLKKALPVHNVDIFDPQYNKNKQYQAFKLHDVLAYVYGDAWLQKLDTDVNFIALDGYQAVSDYKKVLDKGGYIVFKDRQYPGWEGIGRNKASPGPFYLVWDDKQKGPKKGYPWPYQLAKIDTVDFKQQYPAVYPHDVAKSSDIYAGFALFKERCMKCHAIDQEGGKVGPDLNAPMNILTYRQRDMVGEYIRQPSKFRYTQMPDHLDLKSSQIDSLLDYLQHQGKLSKK
ncbi:cytochrome c [Photobacterium sanctipauli]|uniref:Cytochrome c n=2 Tax=Photobacterium sanctipauli TaxID=1342794 RepID=A0A2T3NXB6_9GAMM|nr:cytochrome c [Photobacterium sanctipauli]